MKNSANKNQINEEQEMKQVSLLGTSSFFNDIGSELITPILPFYISALGGGGLAVGLVSGLREGLASFFKFFGGWLSDKVGKRKPFVFAGYLMSVIFRFMISLSTLWYVVVGFVSLERFGKLRDAPRDAMICSTTKENCGKAFGFHQAMDTMGGVIGTVLAIFLFWKLNLDIKTIIIIAASISILSLIPLHFAKEPNIRKKNIGFLKSVNRMSKKLKYFVFVSSLFTLANFGLYMFLILRAEELSGNVLFPLILFAIFNFVYAIFSEPFGKLSDRIGRKKVLLLGYVLFFVLLIGFIFLQNLFYFSILFVLYGLVYALTQPNQRALVSDLSDDMKATAFGFFSSVVGIVNIFGGLIAGILWDISYSTMFIYLAIVSFISIIFLLFVKENINKENIGKVK